MKIIPVVLSGGSGTRLWPLSRNQSPKQYLSFFGKNTMLQETLLRIQCIDNITNPIIICNSDHRFLVAEQCQQINIKEPTILLEPVGRNTAPAITIAALYSFAKNKNAILMVLPADHIIEDTTGFTDAIKLAYTQAKAGKLVTFGVLPTEVNSEYGYIKISKNCNNHVRNVEQFVEKPDLNTAKSYIEQGNYLWNSGMFMFKTSVFIEELSKHAPNIINSANLSLNDAIEDLDFIRFEKKAFASFPNISIDHALFEKSKNVVVVILDAKWNDMGSWNALYEIGKKDINGNVIKGNVITQETSNSFINSCHRLVTTIGIDKLIIVETPDSILITTQKESYKIKSILKSIEKKGGNELLYNHKVYSPWGWYETIDRGNRYQVKKLHVKPIAKLSLQLHYKRAEHWVVIKGTAQVINGNNSLRLEEGETTFIPTGTKHCLENQANEPLEVIEVQIGDYLGEDDIVRFEDIYGRI